MLPGDYVFIPDSDHNISPLEDGKKFKVLFFK